MKQALVMVPLIVALPALAEDTRQMDAHEHGVGGLNIAIDGRTVVMEFHAPGADIVGFEHPAEDDADLAAVNAAVETLSNPFDLFVLPDVAACTVVTAEAELESELEHDAHEEHNEHDEHDDAHEEHDEHDEHDKEDHGEEAGHTEFHAEYTFECENPDAVKQIAFTYFEAFPNAKEVDVQLITSSGARAFEVERDAPVLDLGR